LPSEETTPPVMNMNRAMGLNFYSEPTDSTRGKTRHSGAFPRGISGPFYDYQSPD
jgi:hypothetical protein